MFKDLSLDSRDIHTLNCAPIQCTVWPRNENRFRPSVGVVIVLWTVVVHFGADLLSLSIPTLTHVSFRREAETELDIFEPIIRLGMCEQTPLHVTPARFPRPILNVNKLYERALEESTRVKQNGPLGPH